jgi:hypothetical protein
MGGTDESKIYFKRISELGNMGDQAQLKWLRVDGYVEPGSIVRSDAEVSCDPSRSQRGWRMT